MRRICLLSFLFVGLGLGWVMPALAAGELVVMDLPTTGPVAPTAQGVYEQLTQGGFDLWWLRQKEPRERDRSPGVVVGTSGSPLVADQGAALPDFVRQGGGVVLVLDTEGDRVAANRALVEAYGVRLFGSPGDSGDVQVRPHPITAGVESLGRIRTEQTLSASGVEVLVSQAARPVAVAGELGQGRFVLILDTLLAGLDARAATGPSVRLLTQAVTWAAGRVPGPSLDLPPVTGPGTSLPALQGQVLVDISAQADRWPEVRRVVEGLLDTAGLRRQALTYVKDQTTLAQALSAGPSLVVISSTRQFDDGEMGALSQYVWHGGAVLALATATPTTVPLLQAFNRMAAEVNFSAPYGRPAGPAVPVAHALTNGLQGWGQMPVGVTVWSMGQQALVKVGPNPVCSLVEFGAGRVLALEALALVPPAGAKTPAQDTSTPFRELVARGLRWLVPPATQP